MNSKTKGLFAWIIAGLIALAFTFLGAQNFSINSDLLAKVNGLKLLKSDVSRLLRIAEINHDQDELSESYKTKLKSAITNNLIVDLILTSQARKYNLAVSDESLSESILSTPEFKKNGKFSKDLYFKVLSNNGFSDASYQRYVKNKLLLQQIPDAIAGSFFITKYELEQIKNLIFKSRDVHYKTMKASSFLDKVTVSEDEIENYYYANLNKFVTPDKMKLNYVLYSLNDVVDKNQSVDYSDLKNFYDKNKDSYGKPLEEIKDLVKQHMLAEKSSNEFQKGLYKLNELAEDNSDSLQEIADEMNLKVITSDYLLNNNKSQKIGSISLDAKSILNLFNNDNLQNKLNSEPQEIATDTFMVARCVERIPSSQQELKDVKEDIKLKLKEIKASEKARLAGESYIKELVKKGTFNEEKGWRSYPNVTLSNNFLPSVVAKAAFEFKFEKNPAFNGAVLPNGDYALIAVTAEKSPKNINKSQEKDLLQNIMQHKAAYEFGIFKDSIQNKAKVAIYS